MTTKTSTKNPVQNYQQILDFIPLGLFFAAYYFKDLFFATLALIVATLLSIAVHYFLKWPLPKKTLISAVFVTLFGGLTLFLDDPFYIKVKSTVSFTIFALVLAGARYGFQKSLLQPLMGDFIELSQRQWLNLSRDTACFFLLLAATNEVVRQFLSTDAWVIFKVFGISFASMIFFGIAIGVRIHARASSAPTPKNVSESQPSIRPKD